MNRRTLLSLFACSALSGCAAYPIPLRERRVNAGLYPHIDDFLMRVASLRRGMTQEEAFRVMGVTRKTPNVLELDVAEIRSREFPEFRPSRLEDMTRFTDELRRYVGFAIPYLHTKDSGALAPPFHYLVFQRGFDVKAILIFRDGMLHTNRETGTPEINTVRKQILLDLATDVNNIRRVLTP